MQNLRPKINIKKYLNIFIIVISLGLVVGFYFVNNTVIIEPNLALETIAPQLTPYKDYYRASVTNIENEETTQNERFTRIVQTLKIQFTSGVQKGEEGEIDFETANERQKLKRGDKIVVAQLPDSGGSASNSYVIIDTYRLPFLAGLLIMFLLLALFFGRLRGATSVLGLVFSIFVLIYFVAPHILQGQNPILVSLIGSGVIAVVSLFFAHGFNYRTSLAVVSTLITLGLAQGLAYIAVHYMRLWGNGSEEAFLLQSGSLGAFNLQGLLLASIIIGTLGILDDVTIGQSVAVHQIHQANTSFSFVELYRKGMAIGREHIASLINTLVLAYAGAFFPLFLLLVLNSGSPWWIVINSEFISEEIVRTLIGSIALILAVPIATALAAYFFVSQKEN